MLFRNRKSTRLKKYDYSQPGAYFVTICVKNRECVLGNIENGNVVLSAMGKQVMHCWQMVPQHFPHAELDEFIIMPDHVHGILWINPVGNKNFCSLQDDNQPWQTKWGKSLSSIIRGFKIGLTTWCRNNNIEWIGWQKSFHDHIIRSDDELNRIRQYIINNPWNWQDENLDNFDMMWKNKKAKAE